MKGLFSNEAFGLGMTTCVFPKLTNERALYSVNDYAASPFTLAGTLI